MEMQGYMEGHSTTLYNSHLEVYRLFATVHSFFLTFSQLGDPMQESLDFDISGLENEILNCNVSGQLDEHEIEIATHLSHWRAVLEEFDGALPVASVRHHFERLGMPDSSTLEMLLSFYLSKTIKSDNDRDKIDLIATAWGHLIMQVKCNPDDPPPPLFRERIEKIYIGLGLIPLPDAEIRDHLEILEYERKQLLTVSTLRDLINKRVLDRSKRLKNNLGELFFQPAVLSAVVALNIGLQYVFRSLFLAEQARFPAHMRPQPAGAEHDAPSPQQVQPFQPAAAPADYLAGGNKVDLTTRTSDVGAELLQMQLSKNGARADLVTIKRDDLLGIAQSLRTAIMVMERNLQLLIAKLED